MPGDSLAITRTSSENVVNAPSKWWPCWIVRELHNFPLAFSVVTMKVDGVFSGVTAMSCCNVGLASDDKSAIIRQPLR